ncbi:SMI1/KNR4 family protein [Streptomyces sp. NPDC048248]|uniref:SMI1/KNR4 family protein n=1 Tax=Streptomyces sp. NPDC048248 TaxID=3365523 RepID=UPI00371D2D0B
MWREIARQALPEVELSEPADPAMVTTAEQRLGCSIPTELVVLLQETDGIVGHDGVETLWPLSRIAEENLHFRSDRAFVDLYMPFDPLLFFGDNGGGDRFAFVRTPPRPDVFVWNTRTTVVDGLPGTCGTTSAGL